mmetsp:Transcript_31969/g.35607  ORF Transcript_31969/g.35607 Transcript_31969/m.35607 type:complete len:97 (+) Transcript_31969:126-416(+)
MCTVPILRLLPQYEEVEGIGVGVSRRDERRNFRHYNIDGILPQYKEAKNVGVGVSRRNKRREFGLQYQPNFWHYNIDQIYNKEVQNGSTKFSFFGI